jgi:hypothetical protein
MKPSFTCCASLSPWGSSVAEVRKLEAHFKGLEFHHVCYGNNVAADVLSKLGSKRALVPADVFVQDYANCNAPCFCLVSVVLMITLIKSLTIHGQPLVKPYPKTLVNPLTFLALLEFLSRSPKFI